MKKIVISTLLATTLLLANNNLNSNQTNSTSKIVESYEKLASQGEIEAMFDLGLMYVTGDGVKQDYAKAREWFLKAVSKNNDTMSAYNLALIYKNGLGVP